MNVRRPLAKLDPVACGVLLVRVAGATEALFRDSLGGITFREELKLLSIMWQG